MALYNNPRDVIIAALNAANSAVMTSNDVILSDSHANTAVSGDPLYGADTVATVSGRPGDEHTGSQTFAYNRWNLGVVFANQLLSVPVNNPTTVHAALGDINFRLSTTFTTDDLEDLPLSGGNLVLTAKPGSLGWSGTITLAYSISSDQFLTFDDLLLDGKIGAVTDTSANQASLWSFDFDFSAYKTLFDSFVGASEASPRTPTSSELTALAAALTAVTGVTWETEVSGNYSLLGATVVGQGIADTVVLNPVYDYALSIRVSSSCIGLVGDLHLHYS